MSFIDLAVDLKRESYILVLPVELILEISEFTTLSDHNNLSRTCKYLTSVLQKSLFLKLKDDKRGGPPGGTIWTWCQTGTTHSIQRALAFGLPPSIDDIVHYGYSMLGIACDSGPVSVVKLLLVLGADPNKPGRHTMLPLALATSRFVCSDNWGSFLNLPSRFVHDSLDAVITLLQAGAVQSCVKLPNRLTSPISLVISLTYERGGRYRRYDDRYDLDHDNFIVDDGFEAQSTVLKLKQVIEMMVQSGAEIDEKDTAKLLPWALRHFDTLGSDFADFVIGRGGPVDFTNDRVRRQLLYSADIEGAHAEAIGYLVSHAMTLDPLTAGKYNGSLLWLAVRLGNSRVVRAMLEHGTNPDHVDVAVGNWCSLQHTGTALAEAVLQLSVISACPTYVKRTKNVKTAKIILEDLLASGADPNKHGTCAPPLYLIVPYLQEMPTETTNYIVDILLRHGADPNLADRSGGTPLYALLCRKWSTNYAEAYRRGVHLAQSLVLAGADVNLTPSITCDSRSDAWAPLALACLSRPSPMVMYDPAADFENIKKLYNKKLSTMVDTDKKQTMRQHADQNTDRGTDPDTHQLTHQLTDQLTDQLAIQITDQLMAGPEHHGISSSGGMALSDEAIDDMNWGNLFIPILLKGGARVSPADLYIFELALTCRAMMEN